MAEQTSASEKNYKLQVTAKKQSSSAARKSFSRACNCFREFVGAILRCLGFISDSSDHAYQPQISCSNSNVKGTGDHGSSTGSTTAATVEKPSSADHPPSELVVLCASRGTGTGRRPERPPVSGGRGPQTN